MLYSPDAFGHPAIWPALAAEFGIRYGVLWRGLGGEPGQDGDLFRWRAPDGREVLLHHLSPDGYEVGRRAAGRCRRGSPRRGRRLKAQLVPRARIAARRGLRRGRSPRGPSGASGALRDLLAELGAGRGGAGLPARRVLRRRRGRCRRACPVLEGELRWSYGYTWTLQGVHATRAPLKRLHAEAELALERMAEPLAALALWHRGRDARPLLDHAWRTLLRSQFHDSIGGCTSDAVAERVAARLGDARDDGAASSRAHSLDALTGNDPDAAREHPGRTRAARSSSTTRCRAGGGGVVVADLSWFRRDVLVGPPGDGCRGAPAPPSERDIAAALDGHSATRSWAAARRRAARRAAALSRSGRGRGRPGRARDSRSWADFGLGRGIARRCSGRPVTVRVRAGSTTVCSRWPSPATAWSS